MKAYNELIDDEESAIDRVVLIEMADNDVRIGIYILSCGLMMMDKFNMLVHQDKMKQDAYLNIHLNDLLNKPELDITPEISIKDSKIIITLKTKTFDVVDGEDINKQDISLVIVTDCMCNLYSKSIDFGDGDIFTIDYSSDKEQYIVYSKRHGFTIRFLNIESDKNYSGFIFANIYQAQFYATNYCEDNESIEIY